MPIPIPPPEPPAGVAAAPALLAGRKNLQQLVELRWLAVAGQLVTILATQFLMGVPLPLAQMLALLGLLVACNLASAWRVRLPRPVTDAELSAALLVDVVVLTAQLYHAGGITNPFVFLYLLQVAVAAVLLPAAWTWGIVGATGLGLVALTWWHVPLGLPGLDLPALSAQYVGGLLVCFMLNAALLVIFIGRIGQNLRERDARLARLRQRAAEEEHIVRMGLLASGAAHELGTPLATLSVILGDWARMAPFAAEPELREELEEMQRQIDRCKAIVRGILQSAGEARAEAPQQTTLHRLLDGLATDWQRSRPHAALDYARAGLPDLPIVADTALRQMVDNVLDNAHEAAPGRPVQLAARCDDEHLVLEVADQGPGFAPAILEQFGQPYASSKAQPGRGLGLFLAVNVARTLGGRIEARQRPGGGALVAITLPLHALAAARPAHA